MEFTCTGAEQRCQTQGQPVQLIQRLTDIPTKKRGLAGTVSSTALFNECQSLRLNTVQDRGMIPTGKTKYRDKLITVPLCPPQTSHGLAVRQRMVLIYRCLLIQYRRLDLRKVSSPCIVTYRKRQQRAIDAIKFHIQQLYHILLLTGGTILEAVFSLMTSLALCIAYCSVRPALNVKISHLALVLIFWYPWYRVCSKNTFFFSREINKLHEE
jgi:hypothetical protein